MPLPKTNPEKRILDRKVFPYPVNFEIADLEAKLNNTNQLTGDAIDINSKGLGMWTQAALKQGDVIKLYVPIPSMNVFLPSLSEVRWVQPVESHYRVGLQFLA